MERHSIGEEEAFTMLRDRARRSQRKLVDVADAVVTGHPMLPARPRPQPEPPRRRLRSDGFLQPIGVGFLP